MLVGDDSTRAHVVLYSGGPDSYITYHVVSSLYGSKHKVVPVHFRMRHRYNVQEELAVIDTVPETKMIDKLSFLGTWEQPDANIYLRNIFLLLTVPDVVSGKLILYLSVQKDELELPDRRPETLAAVTDLFSVLGISAEVRSLWFEQDKVEMIQTFLSCGGDVSKLLKTWSCYTPSIASSNRTRIIHCGTCPACVRRHVAFKLALGVDETVYLEEPKASQMALRYLQRARDSFYSPARCDRILEALS